MRGVGGISALNRQLLNLCAVLLSQRADLSTGRQWDAPYLRACIEHTPRDSLHVTDGGPSLPRLRVEVGETQVVPCRGLLDCDHSSTASPSIGRAISNSPPNPSNTSSGR